MTWDSQAHTLRYWVDGKLGGTLTGDIATQYLGGQTTAYVGFTGATGGATDIQQVRVAAVDAYFANISNGHANVQNPIALSNSAIVNGSATYDSAHHTFVLTPDAAGKAGSAMLNQRIDLSYDFQASFDVYLGKNANGADGLSFVLQNDPRGAKAIGGGWRQLRRSGDQERPRHCLRHLAKRQHRGHGRRSHGLLQDWRSPGNQPYQRPAPDR